MGVAGGINLGMLIAFGLSVVSIILLAASCGGNDWLNGYLLIAGTSLAVDRIEGLWKVCIVKSGECEDYGDVYNTEPYMYGVRAIQIMAILSAVGSIIGMGMLHMKKIPVQREVKSLSATALAGIVAMGIYTGKSAYLLSMDPPQSYGWSFILGWIGAAGFLLAAGVLKQMVKEEDVGVSPA